MAYVTGTANSLTDLLAAIQNACTANGWALSAGGVLSKGTCFAELKIASGVITIRGGTGVDGSGNLTGACNTTSAGVGFSTSAGSYWCGAAPWTWPVTYFIHVLTAPDEVYVVSNYGTRFYQTFGFGQSTMPGLVGSGNWYAGAKFNANIYLCGTSGETTRGSQSAFGLFMGTSGYGPGGGGVHHSLDSATWAVEGAWRDWASLFYRQPSQWNLESILIPIRVYASRPSSFLSPVLECAHARFINIANVSDQQIITLGSDKWKVYPFWSRDPSIYSWVMGHAIRYDGP